MKKLFLNISLLILLTGCSHLLTNNDGLTGNVKAKIVTDQLGNLCYTVTREDTVVLNKSRLGIIIDKVDLGSGVTIKKLKSAEFNSDYKWNGTKSVVNNHFTGQNYIITHTESGKEWTLETRTYNDGFAFRYVVDSDKEQFVNSETTSWNIPQGTDIWHHVNKPQYEKDWQRNKISEIKSGYNSQLPITMELADGTYAAITESGGFTHSGLSLKYDGTNELKSFYRDDQKGWKAQKQVATPWRIVMTGPGLNELVNCDIVSNVCPAPDKALFPQGSKTEWIKPGRSLWQWWGYWNAGTKWDKQRWFVDRASELNCQYYMVDEGWEHTAQGWITKDRNQWEALKDLADYARSKDVKLLVWRSWYANDKKQWPGLETFEKRKEFFAKCVKAGAYGAKIDFLGSESVARRTYVRDVLKEAAAYKLMINFHGSPKPMGENRTFPNEITREGIKGLEHNKWSTIPAAHYATTQFTRLLAGHGDFTPTTFQPKFIKGTTSALQLASAITYTSSVLHWADKPEPYLASPAVDLIREMPTVWDETIVLPGSKIGELSVFARRKGQDWYVAIINGGDQKTYNLDLSFLSDGKYSTTSFSDVPTDNVKLMRTETITTSRSKIKVKMNKGGGFVSVFKITN